MNGQQMVNLGLYRYGKPVNAPDARAEFLSFLNLAHQEFWQADDWPFKREEATLTIQSTVAQYDIPAGDIYWVADKTGLMLTYVPPRTFRTLYRPLTTTGTPTRYTVEGTVDGPPLARSVQLWLFPTPTVSAAGNGTISREIVLADLTDATGSVSLVPSIHHAVIVEWGLMLMAAQQNNELFQVYMANTDKGLEAMRRKYSLGDKR